MRLEAKEEGVSVEQEEIDKEIDKIIESIGGEEMFNDALRANNITLKDLRDQIEIDPVSYTHLDVYKRQVLDRQHLQVLKYSLNLKI